MALPFIFMYNFLMRSNYEVLLINYTMLGCAHVSMQMLFCCYGIVFITLIHVYN